MSTQARAVLQHLATGGGPAAYSYLDRLSTIALHAAELELEWALRITRTAVEKRRLLDAAAQAGTERISVSAELTPSTDTSSTSPQT